MTEKKRYEYSWFGGTRVVEYLEGRRIFDTPEFIDGKYGAKVLLSRDINSLSNIQLNAAVVGNSGTGKSSFINAIRRLTAEDEGAAKVGVIETTFECKPFAHPENKNFVFWDLPGVGTPNFPKATYLDRVRYYNYDFFIIMSSARCTENDLWLAIEAQKWNKKFFFVRSKIDKDLEDDKNDHPSTHNEMKVLQTIRKRTEVELIRHGVKQPKVFLISNRERSKYDFGKLNTAMLSSCDDLRLESEMMINLHGETQLLSCEEIRWPGETDHLRTLNSEMIIRHGVTQPMVSLISNRKRSIYDFGSTVMPLSCYRETNDFR